MRKLFLLIALAFALGTQAQVSGNFIDLTVHNAPNLPTAASLVSFGTIRGWDIGATMNVLNPSSGTFVWTALDAFLNSSTATSKDLIYTFGYLPTWMSSNPTGACTQGPTGTCYPPSDIGSGNTNFSNFVTALVNHSLASRAAGHGYIRYYEVWNEPNATDVGSSTCPPSCGTWYGTIAQFNTMVATEYSVIHSLDPTAQLIGPALSHSDSASNITFLNDFLSASGSKISAVSGHHYDGFFNPVFSMVNDYNDIIAAESLASLSLPVWYTEGNCSQASVNPCTTDAEKIAVLGQRYLSRLSLGVTRDVYYAFDGTHGDNIWVSGTGLTPEGIAYAQLSNWLVGATGYSCTTNGNSGSTLTTWRCSLTQANGKAAQILFLAGNSAISGGSTLSVSAGSFAQYQTLGSATLTPVSGGNVTIGTIPLMLLPPTSTDIYYSQTAQGSNNGTSCANSYAWNDATNGISKAAKWIAGNTLHICGTWNGSAGQQWIVGQASGTSGNPITIKFEPGAVLQAPYHSSGAGINISGFNYITIDGGTNGIYRNTLNGTSGNACPGGSCTQQQISVLIQALGSSNFTLKNLNCGDVYDVTGADGFASSNQNGISCVQIRGSNVLIQNNTVHDAGLGIDNTTYTTDANYQIANNNIYNTGWALGCAGGTNIVSSYYFYGNHVHDLKLWAPSGVHVNGIHCYAAGAGGIQNFYMYNNLFNGDMGNTSWTSWVYMETNCCGSPGVWSANGPGLHAWNNITISNLNLGNGAWAVNGGTANEIYNNTFIDTDTTGDNGGGIAIGSHDADATTAWTIRNNGFSGGAQYYSLNSQTTSVTASNNGYANLVANGNEAFNWAGKTSGSTNTLAAWQAVCGCDSAASSSLGGSLGVNLTTAVPQTGSMLTGLGANVCSLISCTGNYLTLASDQLGGSRPTSGSWVAGAVNFPGATAASPVISPSSGSYAFPFSVSMTCATPGCSMYYTTNGSTPTPSSTHYTGPFTITGAAAVQAISTATGYNNSGLTMNVYTATSAAPAPSPAFTFNMTMTCNCTLNAAKTVYACTCK